MESTERLLAEAVADRIIGINDQIVQQFYAEPDPSKRPEILREERERIVDVIEPRLSVQGPTADRRLVAEQIATHIYPINTDAQNRLPTALPDKAAVINAERKDKIARILEPNIAVDPNAQTVATPAVYPPPPVYQPVPAPVNNLAWYRRPWTPFHRDIVEIDRRGSFWRGFGSAAAIAAVIGLGVYTYDQAANYPNQYTLTGAGNCITVSNAAVVGSDFTVTINGQQQDPNPSPGTLFAARIHNRSMQVCGTNGNTVIVDTGGSDKNLNNRFVQMQQAICGSDTACRRQSSIIYQ